MGSLALVDLIKDGVVSLLLWKVVRKKLDRKDQMYEYVIWFVVEFEYRVTGAKKYKCTYVIKKIPTIRFV